MALCRISGIVLKTQNWRETSELVTLYTREFGKIKAIAKGLKSKKGKGTGGLSQFSENEIVLYKKKNGLHLIDRWSLKNSQARFYKSFKKLVVASVMAEMMNEYIEGEESNSDIYGLLKDSFSILSEIESEELSLASFTVHFLAAIGYRPNFKKCLRCGKREFSNPIFFSLKQGTLLCNDCKTNEDKLVIIDREMKGSLEYLQMAEPEKSGRLKISLSLQKQLCDFLILFLNYTLGKEIKSVSLLKSEG